MFLLFLACLDSYRLVLSRWASLSLLFFLVLSCSFLFFLVLSCSFLFFLAPPLHLLYRTGRLYCR